MDQSKAVFYAGSSYRDRRRYEGDRSSGQRRSQKNILRYQKTSATADVRSWVSTSFFVPKPFTPFQWAGMFRKEDYLDKAKVVKEEIRAQLNQKSIKYNYHEADVTVLEGILARGDRKVADVLEGCYKKGAIFDSWSEYFRYDLWMEALKNWALIRNFIP